MYFMRSNNTNKLSPQELVAQSDDGKEVQIIQINLVLKNIYGYVDVIHIVQIIQINLVLKNTNNDILSRIQFK